ncbi:MAG: hypothetical protein E7163_00815 [Firmicutes bacterium]|nr:hypothetical protein [Bacillota bacterium]
MSIEKENIKKLHTILNKYKLSTDEKEELLNIILNIFKHDEFQKRMTNEFQHHGEITLGEHILEDAVVTFLLSKKYKHNNGNFDMYLAIKIAMLHDLYTLPWQNNEAAKVNSFFNKHGFRHPIEAVINANKWYPEIFETLNDSKIIIDGIVHHMFPLPVRTFNDTPDNEMELKNFQLVENLSEQSKSILIGSSNRNKMGPVSISRSIYPEGVIVSKADKKVSSGQIKNLDSASALITGYNASLDDNSKKR